MNPYEIQQLIDVLAGTTAAYYFGVLLLIPLGLMLMGVR
jgi:hypothetical protein